MQNGWNMSGLVGIWHTAVNIVNFADLLLHLCYIGVLWQGLAILRVLDNTAVMWHDPSAVAAAGLLLAYLMAQWLPQQQHKQHTTMAV